MPREFTYRELTSGVRTLSDPLIQWWSSRLGTYSYTPRDVCDLLTWGLPGARDNLLERIDIGGDRASVEVKGLDELGEIFWASRTMQFRFRELNLDVLKVREDYQSQGYEKVLLRNAYRFAKTLGFDRLTVTAIDVGSYAWSKAAFHASIESWKDPHCRGRIETYILERRADFGSALSRELLDYARSDNPRSLWTLAMYDDRVPLIKRPDVTAPLGFALLSESGCSWYGTIELKDGEIRDNQIALVRDYIGLDAGE